MVDSEKREKSSTNTKSVKTKKSGRKKAVPHSKAYKTDIEDGDEEMENFSYGDEVEGAAEIKVKHQDLKN